MNDVLLIIIKRLLIGLITLLVISIVIFGAVELLPGDLAQAILGQAATEETVAAMRARTGVRQARIRALFCLA